MLGEVNKGALITPAGARPGDAIILTKGLAIEGTAILARECEKRLKGLIPDSVLKKARRFLHKPGISVVLDARIALQAGTITAMHDPTEGGVATALRELAQISHQREENHRF
jgi:hydrogenase maturation factor